MARERGRVSERRAQALGFVSRMMVRRDGGGSEYGSVRIVSLRRKNTNPRWTWCNGQNHPQHSWWLYHADWHLDVQISSLDIREGLGIASNVENDEECGCVIKARRITEPNRAQSDSRPNRLPRSVSGVRYPVSVSRILLILDRTNARVRPAQRPYIRNS